jgi:hypothetical protein
LIPSKQTCPINLLSNGIPDAISNFNSDTIAVTISKAIPDGTEAISKSNPDHSHRSTQLQESGLGQWLCKAVGEHRSSWYIAPVNLSISSHICSKIVLGRNVCNCISTVDSVLDTHE